MKKLFLILLSFILIDGNSLAGSKWGRGELKLDDFVVDKFIEYIKGGHTQTPYLFAVSKDGWGYNYYYCGSGMQCQGGAEQILEECSRYSKGVECFLFARKRTIKWNNGINPGKGKASKISSKLSDSEIRAKLTELGFLGQVSKSNSNSKKITNSKKNNITKELKELKELFDSGVLSKEEFEKAKKKILN